MTERELARLLQATAGDDAEWGEAVPTPAEVRTEKRRLAAMVSVRLAPEELSALQEHVRQRGESISAFMRALALQQINRSSAPNQSGSGFRVVDASVGVSSFTTTSKFVHAQVVTHPGVPA